MLLNNCILHIFDINNIIYRKRFRPVYAQLGMLSALFPNVPIVALTATATEKTRNITANSLGMVDPVIIAVNPDIKHIFYTAARRQRTGDDNMLYVTKLKELKKKMPLTVCLFHPRNLWGMLQQFFIATWTTSSMHQLAWQI